MIFYPIASTFGDVLLWNHTISSIIFFNHPFRGFQAQKRTLFSHFGHFWYPKRNTSAEKRPSFLVSWMRMICKLKYASVPPPGVFDCLEASNPMMIPHKSSLLNSLCCCHGIEQLHSRVGLTTIVCQLSIIQIDGPRFQHFSGAF